MKYTYNHPVMLLWTAFSLLALVSSCANMASPNGGPYDEDPPHFLSSTPKLHAVNYTGKKIEITFDELIQIERPSENVIITPPQKNLPVIRPMGKKVVVELNDTLVPNVTYTIDFTGSISDNNEKNAIENFSFAFSTGDRIDSLEISGVVLNAENLEPMPNIMVGLHPDLADSAFTTQPFFRTSKTNDRGRFIIRNIAEGSYRLYALNDANRDYLFDQPGEEIAFHDSIVVPTFEPAIRMDTLWKDSLTVDTIRMVEYTRFMPDDIVLCLFKEKFRRQYMLRPERTQENLFALKFNAPVDSLPGVELLDGEPPRQDWYLTQKTDGGATLNYWIADSTVWKKDTLHLKVSYLKSDSFNIPQPQTDTIHLSMRQRPAVNKKKSKKEEPVAGNFLSMQLQVSGKVDLSDTLAVTFQEPVPGLEKAHFVLEQEQDTLWTPVEFTFRQDSFNILKFYIERSWQYGENYRLSVDSASIYSLYGKWNEAFLSTFQFKARDEYGHLFLGIEGIETPAFVELLNTSDAPVRKAPVQNGGALFMNLKPETYYARIVLDTNGNGIWDTGNYALKQQPEEVFYAPRSYQIPVNFEIEETWNVLSGLQLRQKPLEITKNKPKDVTKKKRNYKEEGQQRSNSQSSGFGGMGGSTPRF
ncbi:MAG: Ig-like domain-containing protein [Tannerella sp.]|nr:Ig-like domain-containing protein [Tannerella sp.]